MGLRAWAPLRCRSRGRSARRAGRGLLHWNESTRHTALAGHGFLRCPHGVADSSQPEEALAQPAFSSLTGTMHGAHVVPCIFFIPVPTLTLGPTEPAVKAGTEYVLDDLMAAQLMSLAGWGDAVAGRVPGAAHRGGPARRMNKVGHQFESALYLRAGGFGDLILLTPVLREHKRQFPNARIGVATMTHYAQVLAGLPFVDEVVPYPLTLEQLYQWDEWVFLENASRRNPAAHKVHMTDLFAQIAGVGEVRQAPGVSGETVRGGVGQRAAPAQSRSAACACRSRPPSRATTRATCSAKRAAPCLSAAGRSFSWASRAAPRTRRPIEWAVVI